MMPQGVRKNVLHMQVREIGRGDGQTDTQTVRHKTEKTRLQLKRAAGDSRLKHQHIPWFHAHTRTQSAGHQWITVTVTKTHVNNSVCLRRRRACLVLIIQSENFARTFPPLLSPSPFARPNFARKLQVSNGKAIFNQPQFPIPKAKRFLEDVPWYRSRNRDVTCRTRNGNTISCNEQLLFDHKSHRFYTNQRLSLSLHRKKLSRVARLMKSRLSLNGVKYALSRIIFF